MPLRETERDATASDWRFFVIALVALLGFASFTYLFRYRNGFSEVDVYWIALGLLDGATSGLKSASPMQYEIAVCFGFYETLFAFLSHSTLVDADRLTIAINVFGWVSAIAAVCSLWLAIALIEDRRTATIVSVLFGLNAVFLEASTSGHPFLYASALLFLGASFLWAPASGLTRAVNLIAATALFSYSLTIRADGFLMFPWFVLMRPDLSSARAFLRSSLVRAIPLLFALLIFFILQSFYANVPHGPGLVQGRADVLVDFFSGFFRLTRIGSGFVYLALTIGFANLLAVLAVAVFFVLKARRTAEHRLPAEFTGIAVGIAALLLPNLIFWLPIPTPPRHFSPSVIAVALGLAAFARFLNLRPGIVAASLAGLIAANESLSELVRRPLLQRMTMPTPNFGDERPTHPLAPVGFVWRHHRSLQSPATIANEQAEQLAAACGRKIVFSTGSGLGFTWFPPFYKPGLPKPRVSWEKAEDISNITVRRDDRELILAFSYQTKLDHDLLQRLYPDAIVVLLPSRPSDFPTVLQQATRGRC